MKKVLGRGMRTSLAAELGCHIGFISQVLRADSHFSLEHSMRICKFLNLSEKESDFFMLLVQKAKSGSIELEKYFEAQIYKLLDLRNQISERVQITSSLSKEDRAQYFSSSNYALIHMVLSIPEYQSARQVAEYLKIDLTLVNNIMDFLLEKGLVLLENDEYKTGPTRIHLEKKSPLITQHHTNTRIESIKSLSRKREEDLHYSGVFTMSSTAASAIKSILLDSIEKSDDQLKNTKDEKLYILGIDFFEY